MKTKVIKGEEYLTPELSVLEFRSEGMLCQSDGSKWYEQGGSGDFSYGTETDDTWA